MATLDDNTTDISTLKTQTTTDSSMIGSTVSLDDPTPNMLTDDSIGEIDWDAPEGRSGSYTPQVYPGVHKFLFALEDDNPFEVREYTVNKGKPEEEAVREYTVNHKGTVSITDDLGNPKEVTIRFNRAGFRRTPKMKEKRMNSRGGELLRSLNIHAQDRSAIEQALREADGRVMGRGVVNWSAYCKGSDSAPHDGQTISTNPNKKRGDVPWPKGPDHKYVESVNCPKCGAALNGREQITDYKLPEA